MPNWKKVIVSGSDASLNSLNVTAGVTGSFTGSLTGALTGSIISAAFILWLTIGSHIYKQNNFVDQALKPISIENCSRTNNATYLLETKVSVNEEPFVLYKVNHWYYMPISILSTIVIGFVISLITRKSTDTVRPDLISPIFRFQLPQVKSQDCQRYTSLDKSLDVIL